MSYREKEICVYRGWEIKEINNGKQNWYCARYNYQDIDADTTEELKKKRTRKKKRVRRKESKKDYSC